MQLLALTCILPLVAVSFAYIPASTLKTDVLAAQSLINLKIAVRDGSLKKHLATQKVSQTCNVRNVSIRREYSTLSKRDKLDYTKAIKCLMNAPSKIPPGVAPGAKSRYDDFVAVHVNQTRKIHFSGWFLQWHRIYIYSFERALQDECDFEGSLPYWNWGKSAGDPLNSPYMDGSKYSQGGNGIWAPHNCTYAGGEPSGYCIPVVEGRGGGCVETGPYVGYMANISASQPALRAPDAPVGDRVNLLRYEPRCIRRSISPEVSLIFGSDAESYDILTNPIYQPTIGHFQDRFEGLPLELGYMGLHGQGHYTIGGDPGGDVYNSPNDPMFWLHHAQVDRTWWIWQNQKPVERTFHINGTRTMFNDPPSDKATIEDIMDMAWVTPKNLGSLPIKEHVSSVGGPYCYVYQS